MSQDEAVTAVIPVSEEDLKSGNDSTLEDDEPAAAAEGAEEEELVGVSGDEDYFVMLTTHGAIKKVPISQFSRIRKKGITAIKLSSKDEEKEALGWVRRSNGKGNIIIGSADGMAIRYEESEVRPMGRSARGVKAMTLREGDRIVGFDIIEPGPDTHMLFVTTDGFGKRVELEEFRVQGRGGVGIIGIKFKNASSRLACLRITRPKTEVLIATQGGIIVRQRTDDISVQGRMATGVRLQQVPEDDQVMSVTAVAEPPEEIDGAADSGKDDGPKDDGEKGSADSKDAE
jgi:DNA gyrase subunit A